MMYMNTMSCHIHFEFKLLIFLMIYLENVGIHYVQL